MHASLIIALASMASATAVRYHPVERDLAIIEKRAAVTAPWVSVDDEGQPQETHTPSMTVVDGTTKIENGAPHDLTASVYTYTEYAKVHTSTGEPPNPTASGKSGQGAFARCFNQDGDNAPFCDPRPNSTLLKGKTYYITWDPDYFNKTTQSSGNSTLTQEVYVRMDYYNHTDDSLIKVKDFDRSPAAWGFFPLTIEKSFFKQKFSAHNITLTLYTHVNGSSEKTFTDPIYLNLAEPSLPDPESPSVPHGKTLSIALPTVFGAIILLVIGGCIWNRKSRRIGLGNVMSRNRNGYTGRKQRRVFGRKDNGIQLDSRDMPPPGDYSDAPNRPRRDSEGLGSLAGSPVDANFNRGADGRNVFRDEMDRQERERNH